MNKYKKILEKALPYYKKGRKGDIEHVKWLYRIVPKFIDKPIDPDILMAVVILHDVGYCKIPKGSNPYDLNIRRLHSIEGAKIAEKILKQLKYQTKKIKEIKRLILKHDDWAFGDNFSDEPVLLLFQNFDFMWMASKKGYEMVRKIVKKPKKDFYKQILKFQRANVKRGIKWYNKKVENHYKELMKQRRKEKSTIRPLFQK